MGNQPVNTRMLLRGATVADGIADTTRRADVLIEGPVIAAVEVVDTVPGDCKVLDLPAGSVICPGFIDAHVHAEGPLLADGRVDGALAQGVTTLVVGQDGESWIGAEAPTTRYLNEYFGPVNGMLDPAGELTVAGFRDLVAGRLAQNVAVLASQGTIRHNVAGLSADPLDSGQRVEARRQLERALEDGAAGLSSGMDYLPSRYGYAEEVADIARPLATAGRPYVSHLRGYGATVRAGLSELTEVGQAAGIRVHASHLWGAPADIAAEFAAADAAGVAMTYDMYPYRRSSTILPVLLLPPEIQAGGPAATIAALTDPRQRAELLAGEKFTDEFLQGVFLGSLPADAAESTGMSVAQAAAAESRPAGEWALDLLVRTRLNAGGHLDRPTLADKHIAWLAAHERQCACSDGIYQGQHPHPRGYGAFARLAGHYLAGDPATGYQQAARHLAANAADVYGLRDRGRLAPGKAADIAVIGRGGITDRAGYDTPQTLAAGVDLVLVNGIIAWRHDQVVPGQAPGQCVS
jgi:N-acyl-D-amino-acid deacylase